jgi:hypothetical protein
VSLLTTIQRACRSLSLTAPASVVASTDPNVLLLWELANEEGEELARGFPWQILRKEHTFTTVAQAAQTDALPDDFMRFIPDTFFNRTTRRNLIGPITPQQWQAIQAQPQLNRVFLAWIERDGAFLITPTPPAGETIAYEYETINWAYDVNDAPKASMDADGDDTYLNERIMRLGIRWRFLSAKGLDYAQAYQTYEIEKEKVQARDGGNTVVYTTGATSYILSPNLPEGSFPGP